MKWRDRVNRALKRGRFSDVDKRLVSEWHTCAVGEKLHRATPPCSSSLFRLGFDFSNAVYYDNISVASEVLDKIRMVKQGNKVSQ